MDTEEGTGVPRRAGARGRRTWVIVGLAVLVGLVVAGTAVVALGGGALFGAPAPTASSPAAPSPTPTTSESPTTTAAPNPPAPVVRVPAECDELVSQATAEELTGTALEAVSGAGLPETPLAYINQRVGSLSCAWSDDPAGWTPTASSVSLLVVPGATADDLRAEAGREGIYIGTPEPEIGDEVYSACTVGGPCSFVARVGDYAVQFTATTPAAVGTASEAVRERFVAVRDTLAALPAPAPLWQPDGATLRGATSCDGLIDLPTLSGATGLPMIVFREYGFAGEYAPSSFQAARQVDAFGCSWTEDAQNATTSVRASVLPGGASYFAEAQAAHPETVWAPTDGHPGEAYLTGDGTRLAVLVDSGWVEVQAPADALPAVAAVVLANVGASAG